MGIFNGVSAFPITPATDDGQIMTDDLVRVLEPLAVAGVDSVGLLGSTGSYAYLDADARGLAVRIAVDALGGRVPLIVGVGAMRTDHAVALARNAAQAGAQGLLLAPMSYTPLTGPEVLAHFRAVAHATDLPLCIYNNPSTTHFRFDTDLIAQIAALPTVAAVKMPLPDTDGFADQIAALRAVVPDGFSIGYSGDWGCAGALSAGADGWFSVAAGLWPVPAMRLARAAQSGDADAITTAEACFLPMWDLFRTHGSLRVVHAAAILMGLTTAVPQRPVLPLEGRHHDALRAALVPLI